MWMWEEYIGRFKEFDDWIVKKTWNFVQKNYN
jgi:hypothetical protein